MNDNKLAILNHNFSFVNFFKQEINDIAITLIERDIYSISFKINNFQSHAQAEHHFTILINSQR